MRHNEAMDPRAVFVDVDGTLIGEDGNVPDSAIAAIQAARAAGNVVCLATGRSTDELWDELLAIGFDGAITGSGASVAIGDQVLSKIRFSSHDVDRLDRLLTETGAIVLYHCDGGSVTTEAGRDWLIKMVQDVHGADEGTAHFGFIEDLRLGLDPRQEDVSKVVYFDSALVTDQVQELLGPGYEVVSGSVLGSTSGEISPAGVTKAAGVALALEHFGIPQSASLALGDSFNDLEMLRYVQVGIAMGNAPEQVRAAADELTGTPEEGGLADAFERHGLLS